MCLISALAGLILSGAGSSQQEDPPTIRIEMTILEFVPDDHETRRLLLNDAEIISSGPAFILDDLSDMELNGESFVLSDASREGMVNVLSSPQVIVNSGEEASIAIAAPIEYLVFDEDTDAYKRRVFDEQEGVSISIRPIVRGDGIGFEMLRTEMTRVVDRDEVEGLDLYVGVPTLSTFSAESNFVLPGGFVAVVPLVASKEKPLLPGDAHGEVPEAAFALPRFMSIEGLESTDGAMRAKAVTVELIEPVLFLLVRAESMDGPGPVDDDSEAE